ncbi:hypothetical protein Tco_1369715 [Tanacetum coccineum]
MSKRARITRGQSSSSQGVSIKEKVQMLMVFESGVHQMHHDALSRLGLIKGKQKEISLLELGWRIGLYSERQSRESATLSGLRKGVIVKANHLLLGFWPTFGDDGFNVGNAKVAAIRDPRVKLAHRFIATTIAGRKESTHRITEINLFYLYCIYSDEVIAQSYGLLTNEIMGALSVEPSPHVFKKKSLISMGVVMKLHNEGCFWPATREVVEEDEEDDEGDEEDDEGDEEAGGGAGHEGAGGSADMYRNMSQGDWQVRQARWIDQQDEHWGRINTWMGQQDERAFWMYDHTLHRRRSGSRSRSRIKEVEEAEEEANHIKLNYFCSDEYPFRGTCKESATSSHVIFDEKKLRSS